MPVSSNGTGIEFRPIAGWWDGPSADAPVGSIVSGANWWVREGRLEKRFALTAMGSNYTSGTAVSAAGLGAMEYVSSQGTRYPVVVRGDGLIPEVAYFNGSWVTLTGAPGGNSSKTPRGTSAYWPKLNTNVFVLVGPNMTSSAWSGIDSGTTGIIVLANAPFGAFDTATCDRRVVMWNTRPVSGATRMPNRMNWSAFNDPTDWTGPGSGAFDLTDVRGAGSRCWEWQGEVVLATTDELWRASPQGNGAWSFAPIDRTQGVPFADACVMTPQGLFWLGRDYLVRRWNGQGVEEVGQAIWRSLRGSVLQATMGYAPDVQQVFVHFSTAETASKNVVYAFAYSLQDKVWTRHAYAMSAPPLALFNTQVTPETLAYLTSNGTTLTFVSASSNASDLGDSGRTASIDIAGIFVGNPTRLKLPQEIRAHVNVTSGSSLSVTVISDISVGGAFLSATSMLQLPATSNESAVLYYPTALPGRRFTLRLDERTGGALTISEIAVLGRDIGRAL